VPVRVWVVVIPAVCSNDDGHVSVRTEALARRQA
jgi:hypothetical protein